LTAYRDERRIRRGDRLLLRTDHNNTYDGGLEKLSESPYLTIGATGWCIDMGVVLVGYDFYRQRRA
jgi:kynurenine formamidase